MSSSSSTSKAFRRTSIVFLWILLIFGILFLSNITSSKSKQDTTLHIFTWSDVIPKKVIKEFEKETGVKVTLDYYSSNEELFVKLKASNGVGYDLVIPSDYAVKTLIKEGMLSKIDHSEINFSQDLNPFLLNHEYDPDNAYSLPLQWDIAGFGIDTEKLDIQPENYTWGHLFDESLLKYQVVMSNDPVEAFCIASQYLFGKKIALSKQEAQQVKQLLQAQKSHVEAYAVPRSDFILASKNAAVAYGLSAYIIRF